MTKDMLIDIIKGLKKKNRNLLICLIIAIVIAVGMTVFAFSSFDITREETTEITYDNDQTATTNGENSSITQTNTNELQDKDNSIYMICGTVIVCVGFIILGVYLYGKSNKSHKTNNKKEKENSDTEA